MSDPFRNYDLSQYLSFLSGFEEGGVDPRDIWMNAQFGLEAQPMADQHKFISEYDCLSNDNNQGSSSLFSYPSPHISKDQPIGITGLGYNPSLGAPFKVEYNENQAGEENTTEPRRGSVSSSTVDEAETPTKEGSKSKYNKSGKRLEINEDDKVALEQEKKRRNVLASARFRNKKKLKEQSLLKQASEMTRKATDLENRVQELEKENKWLRDLLLEKNPHLLKVNSKLTNAP